VQPKRQNGKCLESIEEVLRKKSGTTIARRVDEGGSRGKKGARESGLPP
jgi:hypothetical protein